MSSLKVKYGEFDDVLGPARSKDGVSIAAARIRLLGESFSPSKKLSDFIKTLTLVPEVNALMQEGYDAPWVRGRMERLFFTEPVDEEDRCEKSGIYASFIAVVADERDELIATPFEISDYYLQTSLYFSSAPHAPPEDWLDRIATAFWKLLLEDPHDLAEYTETMSHVGGGFFLTFGVANANTFIEETEDDPRERKRRRH